MELITPDITCSYTSSLGVAAVTGTKPFFDLPSGNVDQHFLKAAEALGKKLGEKALKQFFAKQSVCTCGSLCFKNTIYVMIINNNLEKKLKQNFLKLECVFFFIYIFKYKIL